jgi:hypothetical protein
MSVVDSVEIETFTWTLANASLAGNVIIATAGGGLPQRLRTTSFSLADRASWQLEFKTAATIKGFSIPGSLGRDQDLTTDERKITCFYSIDGGTRVEFIPGQMNLDIAIVAGEIVRLDADFISTGTLGVNDPWIGGSAGEGPSVVYDGDPIDTVAPSVVSTSVSASLTTVTVIFSEIMQDAGLTTVGNYTITGPSTVTVTAVTAINNNRGVLLTVSGLIASDQQYTVTASTSLKDVVGNNLA